MRFTKILTNTFLKKVGFFLNILQDLQAHIRLIVPDLPLPEPEKQRVLMGVCSLPVPVNPEYSLPTPPFQIITSDEQLVELGFKLKAWELPVVFDIETTSLTPESGEIVSIGIGLPGSNFYIPVAHTDSSGVLLPNQFPLLAVVQALPFKSLKIIAHNGKFEFSWLKYHTGVELQIYWDTFIGGKLLDFDKPADLESMACREVNAVAWALSKQEMEDFSKVPLEKAANYNAADLTNTFKLFNSQREMLFDDCTI